MIFIFPIGMLCILVFESVIVFRLINWSYQAFRGFNVDENMLKTLFFITEMATALEAFFESGPQIIQQIYIACATREVMATHTTVAELPNGHLPENNRYPDLPQDMGML